MADATSPLVGEIHRRGERGSQSRGAEASEVQDGRAERRRGVIT